MFSVIRTFLQKESFCQFAYVTTGFVNLSDALSPTSLPGTWKLHITDWLYLKYSQLPASQHFWASLVFLLFVKKTTITDCNYLWNFRRLTCAGNLVLIVVYYDEEPNRPLSKGASDNIQRPDQ